MMKQFKPRRDYFGFVEALFDLPPHSLTSNTVGERLDLEDKIAKAAQVALSTLLPRYATAVQKYYGLSGERTSAREISEELTITAGRVHQMLHKGLRVLRDGTCFDQLALELTTQGHTSYRLEIASNRARIVPAIEALEERLKNHTDVEPRLQFLIDHKIDCNEDNPCPTCRANDLFASVGITTQMQELLFAWNTNTPPDLLDLPIDLVLPGLTVRTSNCLKNDNLRTLRQLIKKTEAEILRTPNFGRKSLNELKTRLGPLGLQFGMKH